MKKCVICSNEFVAKGRGTSRRTTCSEACKKEVRKNAIKKYQSTNSFKEYQRMYRATEKCKKRRKMWRESYKDDYVVYELECGWIGQTNQPFFRMQEHKGAGRTTDNYKVLATCPTEEEARDLESLYQILSLNYKAPDSKSRLKPCVN